MKKIAILYTGGTIGMNTGAHGLAPDADFPRHAAPHLGHSAQFVWHRADELIDSAALTPQHWAQWIAWARQTLPAHDGLLILHGTDTLAYTAALFALVFAAAGKPLVFTGAQKTLHEADSDAAANLRAAAALFETDFRACGTVFADTLFDPADCRKHSTESRQGFAAVYRTPFGHYDGQWQLSAMPAAILPPPGFTRINPSLNIAACTLVPGFTLRTVTQILDGNQCDALILRSYGHGNAPDDADFLAAVRRFCAQGKIVFNLSQVWQGNACARYAQNHALAAAGVINGGQTTPELALAKLTVGLSAGLRGEALRHYLTTLPATAR